MSNLKEKKEEVIEEVKETIEKVKEKLTPDKEIEPLVVCRPLFYTILDKILIVILILNYIGATIFIFDGKLGSMNYSWWSNFGTFIIFNIIFAVICLIVNIFYKCISKTMLAVTKNEIFLVAFTVFSKKEKSIPLNKVTAVSAHRFCWIFRYAIVHQYMQMPLIFPTWNAKEFKDKVNELTSKDDKKIKNDSHLKNLIPNEHFKFYLIGVGVVFAIVLLLGLVRFVAYMANPARSAVGTYTYKENTIELFKDGKCKTTGVDCDWSYNEETNVITLSYETSSYYYYSRTVSKSYAYDKSNETLTDTDSEKIVYTRNK